jgi:hypothetical protein
VSFDGWLDARDAATAVREWATMDARGVPITSDRSTRSDAVAVLAASFLGHPPHRFAWFMAEPWESEQLPPATARTGGEVPRLVFDGVVLCDQECGHSVEIREVVEGMRGVHHIKVDWHWGEFTREGGNGGGATFVRVFDRSSKRAVSIRTYHDTAWVIGDAIDLAPLDLFEKRMELELTWKTSDVDMVRGLVAQLVGDLAGFEMSTTWPGGMVLERINEVGDLRFRQRDFRYAKGAFAIAVSQFVDLAVNDAGRTTFVVEGLPTGWLRGSLETQEDPQRPVTGSIVLRLPRAQLEATLERLAGMAGIAHVKITS